MGLGKPLLKVGRQSEAILLCVVVIVPSNISSRFHAFASQVQLCDSDGDW